MGSQNRRVLVGGRSVLFTPLPRPGCSWQCFSIHPTAPPKAGQCVDQPPVAHSTIRLLEKNTPIVVPFAEGNLADILGPGWNDASGFWIDNRALLGLIATGLVV
jgi:hypothetical protein